jgi:hypothetical protein
LAFASHQHFTRTPINVIDLNLDHFSGAHPRRTMSTTIV